MLKKCRINKIQFSPVYFNSTRKTVINDKVDLHDTFQEILNRIENWINEGSGWVIESAQSQYFLCQHACWIKKHERRVD